MESKYLFKIARAICSSVEKVFPTSMWEFVETIHAGIEKTDINSPQELVEYIEENLKKYKEAIQ